LSLLAIPWLTGFYSKDLIIELAYVQYKFNGIFAFLLGSITAGLTAFYSFRLISLVFLNYPNSSKISYQKVHESNIIVVIPLLLLSIFSIFFGFIFYESFVGIGTDFLGNSINIQPIKISQIEAEFNIPLLLKLLPILLSIIGALLSIYIYNFSNQITNELIHTKLGQKIYSFLNGKYYFDILYNKYIIIGGLQIGYTISKELDRGALELIGPYGISLIINNLSKNIAKLDTGIITSYALYIVLSLIVLIFILFSPLLLNTSLINENEIRLIFIYLSALVLL
jgi:NADH-ubiquinone oxidoreductase chain 5